MRGAGVDNLAPEIQQLVVALADGASSASTLALPREFEETMMDCNGMGKVLSIFIFSALLACGSAPQGSADGTGKPPDGSGGSENGSSPNHPEVLVGRWSTNFGGFDGQYRDEFEFRADGTADQRFETPGYADDSSSWITQYACQWSVAGLDNPRPTAPWILQTNCTLTSRSLPTGKPAWMQDYSFHGQTFDGVMKITAVAPFSFVEQRGVDKPELITYSREP